MRVAANLRGAAAIAACIALLVLTALWNEYPIRVPQIVPSEEAPYGVTDQVRIASTIERVAKISISLFALIGVSAYVSTTVRKRKILFGATSSTTSALLAMMILDAIFASGPEVRWIPRVDAPILVICAASFLLGAGASWAMGRWPNTSLERTRDR
jgi:hypothetical protein